MGTNYYAIKEVTEQDKAFMIKAIKENDFASVCNLMPEKIHIGKSSVGWEFVFNHNDWEYFDSLESLKEFIDNSRLTDEYEREISSEDFWQMVEQKKGGLHSEKYAEKWDEIHPGMEKPYYMKMGEKFDLTRWGLRFSTSTEFS